MSNLVEVSHYQYCIQEHHAPQAGLHWDLRLEWNGVARSWALRKEPPQQIGIKRLAIAVNDHLLDYMTFQDSTSQFYVKLWDQGTYEIINVSDTWIIELHGERLHGIFTITPFWDQFLFYRLT